MTTEIERRIERSSSKVIGRRLADLRLDAGLSQREVAERGNGRFSQASVSNYETGRRAPTFWVLVEMINALEGGAGPYQVRAVISDLAMEVIRCSTQESTPG